MNILSIIKFQKRNTTYLSCNLDKGTSKDGESEKNCLSYTLYLDWKKNDIIFIKLKFNYYKLNKYHWKIYYYNTDIS